PERRAQFIAKLTTQTDPERTSALVEAQRICRSLCGCRDPQEFEIMLGEPQPPVARALSFMLDAVVERIAGLLRTRSPIALGIDETEDMIQLHHRALARSI